jgi:hypothetical protein
VLLCGCLAAITGTLIILYMPLAWLLRILLAAVFIGESFRELRKLARGAARLRQLWLDAEGNVAGLCADGRCEPLTLLSGSIVLKRLAWLRVRFADGSEHGELFQGDPATDPEWQRLQLIWRHRRTPIGSQDGS